MDKTITNACGLTGAADRNHDAAAPPHHKPAGLLPVLVLIALAAAGPPASAQNVKLVTPKVIDFGRVRRDIVVKDSIGLFNHSRVNVMVKSVSSSCGCTVPELSLKALAPGDTLFIPFTFNTKGYRGLVRKNLTVHFEKNAPMPLRVSIEARVYADFEIDPRYIYLQQIPNNPDNRITQVFTMTNNTATDIHVKKISCENSMISITPDTFTLAPRRSRSFDITIRPDQSGRHHIQVFVDSDFENQKRIIIPIYLYIRDKQ